MLEVRLVPGSAKGEIFLQDDELDIFPEEYGISEDDLDDYIWNDLEDEHPDLDDEDEDD